MNPKKFALVGGIIMLAIGILSLIPAFTGPYAGLPSLSVEGSYGLFLGRFPMNVLSKLALIIFGIAGIVVARDRNPLSSSVVFARWVCWTMGILAFLGLFPQTNTLFGYWPLFGYEVVVHAVLALFGAYYGYGTAARNQHKVPINRGR